MIAGIAGGTPGTREPIGRNSPANDAHFGFGKDAGLFRPTGSPRSPALPALPALPASPRRSRRSGVVGDVGVLGVNFCNKNLTASVTKT
jgi:hypothetical protein